MKNFKIVIPCVTLALEMLAVIFMLLPASEPVSETLFFTVSLILLCTIISICLDFLPDVHKQISSRVHDRKDEEDQ